MSNSTLRTPWVLTKILSQFHHGVRSVVKFMQKKLLGAQIDHNLLDLGYGYGYRLKEIYCSLMERKRTA